MARNVAEIYLDNPSTTLGNNDLLYSGKSPYGTTNDSAIKYGDLFTQISSGLGTQATKNITFNAGNPNGLVAGDVGDVVYDTQLGKQFFCTISGDASTAVWTKLLYANIPATNTDKSVLTWSGFDSGVVTGSSGWTVSSAITTNGSLVGAGLSSVGQQTRNVTLVTTTPYTVTSADYIIDVTVAGAATVNLFSPGITGRLCVVRDNSGAASSNNITVNGNTKNINGASTYVINTNYGSACFYFNGTQWGVY